MWQEMGWVTGLSWAAGRDIDLRPTPKGFLFSLETAVIVFR